MIYLDNNATTPVDRRVSEAIWPFFGKEFGNPSSPHGAGRGAREAVERARSQLAELLGVAAEALFFTSGGTESISTAVRGALAAQPSKRHIVTSTLEHSATKNLCEQLEGEGYRVTGLPVDSAGQPNLAAYEKALSQETALVSLVWANNETGVLFPIGDMAQIADERGVVFHADAVQAVGKIPIDLQAVPLHLLSLSAHKFHGPKGVGALYVRPGLGLPPLMAGGGQEGGRRGGTENVPGIVGLGEAAELACLALATEMPRVALLRDRFEEGLRQRFPGVSFHGGSASRLPNTSNFSLPGFEAEGVLAVLDRLGVACSIGSACSSGQPDASHVLRAMGVSDDLARSSLRFSFSRQNTEEEMNSALSALVQAGDRLRPFAAGD